MPTNFPLRNRAVDCFGETSNSPLVSVIILNYNGERFLSDCVSSVLDSNYKNLEVLVVDNGSIDESADQLATMFKHERRLRVLFNGKNLGYAAGSNRGIQESRGDYVMLLNNDTVVEQHCIGEIIQTMKTQINIGAAQPKTLLMTKRDTIDSTGGFIDRFGYSVTRGHLQADSSEYDSVCEVFYVSSAAMYPRNIFGETGLFDESYFILNEDVDLCWRIRLAGCRVIYVPHATVYHHVSATLGHNPIGEIMWHLRRNRISTVVKNYSLMNAVKALMVLLFLYNVTFVKELFISRDLQRAASNLRAVSSNLVGLRSLMIRRGEVQTRCRKVSDAEIVKHMSPVPVFLQLLREK